MKLFYTKEIVENSFLRIKENESEALNDYQIRTPVSGIIKKINGEKSIIGCFIDIDNQGILVILMHSFKIEKIQGYRYFNFDDIQGIKIKKGILNAIIKIQFIDGSQYVFQIMDRKFKYIPDQKSNLENIISKLESLNLKNMDNKIYKKYRRDNRLIDYTYLITLSFLEFITIIILNNNFKSIFKNELLFILIILLAFGVHFLSFLIFGIMIDYLKDIKFIREYTTIIEGYSQTKDAYKLLNSLLNIKNLPKTQERKNIYYLSLSTAYYKTNNNIEAKNQLLKIKTNDKSIIQKVKRQLELIEE